MMKCISRKRGTIIFFLLCALSFAWSSFAHSAGQPPAKSESISKTTETMLSDSDWKLGSFSMEKGEPAQAFLPKFDDSGFRTVKVPGEVQLQIGLQGMDQIGSAPCRGSMSL